MRDGEAKEIIKLSWPRCLPFDKQWNLVRATDDKNFPRPYLMVPGSRALSVYSDGLYVRFGCDKKHYIEYADILAIEISATLQNFYDKRSRYAEQNVLALYCQPKWLSEASFLASNPDRGLQNIPVRYRAVLFVLDDDLLRTIRSHLVPWGTEYYLSAQELADGVQHLQTMLPEARYFGVKNA